MTQHQWPTRWPRGIRKGALLLALLLAGVGCSWAWQWGWPTPLSVAALLSRDIATVVSWLLLGTALLLWWSLRTPRHQAVPDDPTPSRTAPSCRARWRTRPDAHRWLGVIVAVPLSWWLLSGSLTLYRAELDVWFTPELRACCSANHAKMPRQQASATTSPLDAQQHKVQQLVNIQRFLLQQPSAASSSSWYIEFESLRKPYLTVHWSPLDTTQTPVAENGQRARQRQVPQLYRQYMTIAGEPVGQPRLIRVGDQTATLGGVIFDVHYTLGSRFWLEPLRSAIKPWVTVPISGVGLSASAALLWSLFSLSGCYLCWRLWRRAPQQLRPVAGWRQGALRWHLWLGLISAAWLLWYGVSAVMMQLGNWRDVPASVPVSEYYRQLFPQPQLPASTALGAVATPLTPAQLQALVAQWPRSASELWPVGKMTWLRVPPDGSGQAVPSAARWLLSADVATNWPAGSALFAASAVQRLDDAALAWAPAPVAAGWPWQLRHALYQLHQSFYLTPWARAAMTALGLMAWGAVVLTLWRWQQGHGWRRRAVLALALEVPWLALFGATLWLQL